MPSVFDLLADNNHFVTRTPDSILFFTLNQNVSFVSLFCQETGGV